LILCFGGVHIGRGICNLGFVLVDGLVQLHSVVASCFASCWALLGFKACFVNAYLKVSMRMWHDIPRILGELQYMLISDMTAGVKATLLTDNEQHLTGLSVTVLNFTRHLGSRVPEGSGHPQRL
jgi:hypothetical protein